jgi:hypothetical protein
MFRAYAPIVRSDIFREAAYGILQYKERKLVRPLCGSNECTLPHKGLAGFLCIAEYHVLLSKLVTPDDGRIRPKHVELLHLLQ